MCHTFILYYAFPFVRFPHIDSSPEMKKAITMKEKFFDNSFRLIDAAYLTISSSFFPFPLGRTQQTEHLAFHNNSILGPLSQELDYRIKKKEENLLFKSTHRRNIRAKTHTHTHIPRNLDRNVRATFSLSMKHRATHLNFWNKKREREKKAHDEKLMTEAANEQMNKKKEEKAHEAGMSTKHSITFSEKYSSHVIVLCPCFSIISLFLLHFNQLFFCLLFFWFWVSLFSRRVLFVVLFFSASLFLSLSLNWRL